MPITPQSTPAPASMPNCLHSKPAQPIPRLCHHHAPRIILRCPKTASPTSAPFTIQYMPKKDCIERKPSRCISLVIASSASSTRRRQQNSPRHRRASIPSGASSAANSRPRRPLHLHLRAGPHRPTRKRQRYPAALPFGLWSADTASLPYAEGPIS